MAIELIYFGFTGVAGSCILGIKTNLRYSEKRLLYFVIRLHADHMKAFCVDIGIRDIHGSKGIENLTVRETLNNTSDFRTPVI